MPVAHPQSPLSASDPLMWGMETPWYKLRISSPADTTAEQEKRARAD